MAAPLSLAIPIRIQIGDISRRDSLVCLASLIYTAYDTSSGVIGRRSQELVFHAAQ
jgi:hypothetical protein